MRKLIILFAIMFLTFSGLGLYIKKGKNPVVISIYDENVSVFEKFVPVFTSNEKKRSFEKVLAIVEKKTGTYGIYIKDLKNQETYTYNESELFYGASLFKVPIAATALKQIQYGEIEPDDELTYLEEDYYGGTGIIIELPFGTRFTVEYVLDRLLKDSDNVAQNMLTRTISPIQLGEAFNLVTMENHFYISNTVTPEQMGSFFENLFSSDYLNNTYKEILLSKMSKTSFDDRIHVGLQENIEFSHKIGNWPETSSWHDCGIARNNSGKIIVCVMSRHTTFVQFLEVTKEVGEFVSLL